MPIWQSCLNCNVLRRIIQASHRSAPPVHFEAPAQAAYDYNISAFAGSRRIIYMLILRRKPTNYMNAHPSSEADDFIASPTCTACFYRCCSEVHTQPDGLREPSYARRVGANSLKCLSNACLQIRRASTPRRMGSRTPATSDTCGPARGA